MVFIGLVFKVNQRVARAINLVSIDRPEFIPVFNSPLNGEVHRALHRGDEYDTVHILILILATRHAVPLTTAVGSLFRVRSTEAASQLAADNNIVVEQGGNSAAVTGHYIVTVVPEIRVHVGMPLDTELIVATDHIVGLEADPAHFVGGVGAVLQASAVGEVRTVFEIPFRKQLAGAGAVQTAYRFILFVERHQELIEAAVAVAMAVDAFDDHVEHDPLQCFVIVSRRVVSNVGTNVSHGRVALFQRRVIGFGGQSFCFYTVPLHVINHRQDNLFTGVEILD